MLDIEELRKLSKKELKEEFQKSSLDLLKLRMAVASRQDKETSKLKALRKYIARIKFLKRALKFEKAPENKQSAIIK